SAGPPRNKNSRGKANGSTSFKTEPESHGIECAASRLLSRRRLGVPKHHNRGPDNVYNKTIIKNIRCRSAMISVIKMKPETNIQTGWRFLRSVFLRLKYETLLTIKAASP